MNPARAYRFSPQRLLTAAAIASFAIAFTCLLLATRLPWLGLRMSASAGPDAAPIVVESAGPGTAIPPGSRVHALRSGTERIALRGDDFAPEPDMAFVPFDEYQSFFDRQGRLANALRAQTLVLELDDGVIATVHPAGARPPWHLPWEFWLQLAAGIGSALVGCALVAFRQGNPAARYTWLAGVSAMIAACSAAIYSTRELALPGRLFLHLSAINHFGTSMCCAGLMATMWHYPRSLSTRDPGPWFFLVCGTWWAAERAHWLPTGAASTSMLIVAGYLFALVVAAIQWRRSRLDLRERAALQWFILTWMGGSGLFMFVVLVPAIAGYDAGALQAYAFGLLLVVVVGVALGVARYRLFELETWWFRAVMLMTGAFTVLAFDVVFAAVLHFQRATALTLALVVAGWLYFPIRQWLASRVFWRSRDLELDDVPALLRDVLIDAHYPAERLLPEALQRLFTPLKVGPVDASTPPLSSARLADDGLALQVPGIGGHAAFEARFADDGRRLFNRRDVTLATAVHAVLERFVAYQTAVERGVERERARVAQDLHDDVGARLLTVLHRSDGEIATSIREALDSLRVAVYTLGAPPRPLSELLGTLRAEASERCEAAGVALDWATADDLPEAVLSASEQQDLMRLLRESLSNALKHAHPTRLAVTLAAAGPRLRVSVENDGATRAPTDFKAGLGLRGMRNRVARLGGELTLSGEGDRVRLQFEFPLGRTPAPLSEGRT